MLKEGFDFEHSDLATTMLNTIRRSIAASSFFFSKKKKLYITSLYIRSLNPPGLVITEIYRTSEFERGKTNKST